MFTFAHSLNQGFGRRPRNAHASCVHAAGARTHLLGAWRIEHRRTERGDCAVLSAPLFAAINPGQGYTLSKLLGMGMDARTNSGRVLI
jgi:hypothetical protein